jgi:hypothetical protein
VRALSQAAEMIFHHCPVLFARDERLLVIGCAIDEVRELLREAIVPLRHPTVR